MARKRHRAEEIVALRQVDVLMAEGRQVADAVRAISVTEVTYYRWRNEFGGLKDDQVKRLKDLETENTRLRRAVSDLTLGWRGHHNFPTICLGGVFPAKNGPGFNIVLIPTQSAALRFFASRWRRKSRATNP